MAVTATSTDTVKKALDDAEPGDLPDALRLVRFGTMVAPLKRTFTGLASGAVQNLTLIDGSAETPTGVGNPNRLPALSVTALRVTSGSATNGARVVTDAGGTAAAPGAAGPGIALLADDGTTVTFEANTTGFVIEYIPRSFTDVTTKFTRT